MLFDLRSRGRRTTVRGVYLGLAILMGGGLILFGVGTGVGGGGLLNAFSNGGNGSSGAAQSAQEKQAIKATRLRPNDASAWASLVQARYQASGQAGNFDASTGSFTASGTKELRQLTQDYQRYAQLSSSPNPDVAIEAARAYGELGNYSGAASAW